MSFTEKTVQLLVRWLNRERSPVEIPLCDYDKLRYELRLCDVLLVEGRSRVSEVIKAVTQSAWSHAALYIGRIHDIENPLLRERVHQLYPEHGDEQLLIESILGKGTIVTPLSHYKHDHLRICRPKGIARQDTQRVIGFAIGRLGREYDIRLTFDLFRFLLPWSILPRKWRSTLFSQNISETTREICSSLLAETFASIHFPVLPFIKKTQDKGFQLFPRNPRLFTPRDFDYSPYFEIIKYPIFELSEHGLYRHLPWGDRDPDGSMDIFTLPSHEEDTAEVVVPPLAPTSTPLEQSPPQEEIKSLPRKRKSFFGLGKNKKEKPS